MYLDRYKVLELPQPSMLLSILNPVLALNELVLGQRFASRMLVDMVSSDPLADRVHLECRACGTIHPASLWRTAAFGNWFGLICPTCEAKIPTSLNVFSFLLLIPTAPLWFPIKLAFEKTLHQRQLSRLRAATLRSARPAGFSYRSMLIFGGIWAAIMFVALGFGMPVLLRLAMPEHAPGPIEPSTYVLMGAICVLGGLLVGLFVRAILNHRRSARSTAPPRQ